MDRRVRGRARGARLRAACSPQSTSNARAEGTDCGPHVDSTPDEATSKELRRALGCLINAERAERNRKQLRPNADLSGRREEAYQGDAGRGVLQARVPGRAPLKARIETSGYLKAGDRYGYGENLGCSTTPAAWSTRG